MKEMNQYYLGGWIRAVQPAMKNHWFKYKIHTVNEIHSLSSKQI